MKKFLSLFLLSFLFSLGQPSAFIIQQTPKQNETNAHAANNLLNKLQVNSQIQYFDAIYLFSGTNVNPVIARAVDTKINNVASTFSATEVLTPNYQMGYGYYGDGSSNIGISLLSSTNAASVYALNDCHVSVYNRTHLAQGIELGSSNGTNGSWLATKYSDNNTYLNLNAGGGVSFGSLSNCRGWFYGERSNATQISLYQNNSLLATSAQNSVQESGQPFYALSLNSAGSVLGTSQSSKKMSIVTIGKSGMDRAVTYAAFQSYLQDLTYPIKTVTGLGDSFMFGTNASSQDNCWFNKACVAKHWDWVNSGVSGQAITSGGTQTGFNLANIPTKTANDYKLVVDWLLNDAYNIYYDASRTVPQFTAAVQAFFDALPGKGWATSDVTWITGWKIGTNIYYTQANVNTLTALVITACNTNGANYVTDFPIYNLAADGVHPENNQAYEKMYIYVYRNMKN